MFCRAQFCVEQYTVNRDRAIDKISGNQKCSSNSSLNYQLDLNRTDHVNLTRKSLPNQNTGCLI